MSTRLLLSLGFALEIVAMPLQAQTFFHVSGANPTGMAVEVQRGIVAGVVVSQPEGRATSIATFAGSLAQERLGGEVPFSTSLLETAHVEMATVPGSTTVPALYRRTVGIGVDTIEFQRPDHTVVLEPFGFHAASALEDWAGRYVFVRTNAAGLVDATDLSFGPGVELEGTPALVGIAPDGRAGLLLLDAATGIVAGAYEPVPGQPVAFALLGKSFGAERVDGVWVTSGADGSWVGGDQGLHTQRLAVSTGLTKAAVSSVALDLQRHARRALAAATARASQDARTGDFP